MSTTDFTENTMPVPAKPTLARLLCGPLLLAAVGCSEHHQPIASVQDMLEDRVRLDGVLLKCDQQPGLPDCGNARAAAARISSEHDAQKAAQRGEDFERHREELRLQQDRERQSSEAQKPDPYHLPVVPIEPPPGEAPHN